MASLLAMATISAVMAGAFVYATEKPVSASQKSDRLPQARTIPSEQPSAAAPVERRDPGGVGETRRPVRMIAIDRRMAGLGRHAPLTISA